VSLSTHDTRIGSNIALTKSLSNAGESYGESASTKEWYCFRRSAFTPSNKEVVGVFDAGEYPVDLKLPGQKETNSAMGWNEPVEYSSLSKTAVDADEQQAQPLL
jgi:hypothetical protein